MLAATLLIGIAIYLAYFVLFVRATRIQAEAELDLGRAVRTLPQEVRRENQQAAARRVNVIVGLFLGTLLVGGIATAVTRSPAALVAAPLSVGLLLLLIGFGCWVVIMVRDMMRRRLGRPDPGTVLLDLGVSAHGTAAVRNAAYFGLAALALAVLSLLGGNGTAGLLWAFFAVLILGSRAAAESGTQFTERGLWIAPRFWTWEELERYVWSDDGRSVAFRCAATTFGAPWLLVPVPVELRDDVERFLQQLHPDGDTTERTGATGAASESVPGVG